MYRESTLSKRVVVVESFLEEMPLSYSPVPVRRLVREKEPTHSGPSRFKRALVNGACGLTLCIVFLGFVSHVQQSQTTTVSLVTNWSTNVPQNVVTSETTKGKPVVTKTKLIVSAPVKNTASTQLIRISQLDPAQYNSTLDYNTWWPSACSATAMTVVINSYGHHYRIADIVAYESSINAITPGQGLMYATGIDDTVKHFGFKTRWLNSPTIQDVVDAGNNGTPVIVGFPPYKWDGGHLLVVRGGKTIGGVQYVHLADSSSYNMQWMTYATFTKYWGGTGAIVTPA